MLSRIRSARRLLSILSMFLRYAGRRSAQRARSNLPVVEVTLFRFVVVVPGVRLDQRSKP